MYARYFNHKQTENALLDRGAADKHVESLNSMKWPNMVRDTKIGYDDMIKLNCCLPDICVLLKLYFYIYFKTGDNIGLGKQNGLLASTLFSAVSSLSLFNIGKGNIKIHYIIAPILTRFCIILYLQI